MAIQLDLPTIYQGADYELTFSIADAENPAVSYNASESSFRMHIRYSIDGKLMLDCTPYFDIVAGSPVLMIPNEASTAIKPLNRGDDTIEGVYDLELVTGNDRVYRLYYGAVTIIREVTR